MTLRVSAAMSGTLCLRREEEYETGTAPATGTDVKLKAILSLQDFGWDVLERGGPRERGVTSDPVSAVPEPNRARADSVPGS